MNPMSNTVMIGPNVTEVLRSYAKKIIQTNILKISGAPSKLLGYEKIKKILRESQGWT